MDHRCLYGHRVPAAFTYAIQSRSCPTCGAPTVTITGYQAARKLTTEVGLEAVAAFSAIRVLESEWVLTPVVTEAAAAAAPSAPDAPAAPPADEEEVVVEDAEPVVSTASVVIAPPAARPEAAAEDARGDVQKVPEPARAPPRPVSRPEPRILAAPPAESGKDAPRGNGQAPGTFEDDFFKTT
ncbi:MAG: hypothetical protein V4850_13915 [Myxococcota bacterium]